MSVLIDTTQCLDPAVTARACAEQNLPTTWFQRNEAPNQFQVPLGRGPGVGWILLADFDLSDLDLTIDHTLTFLDDQGNTRKLKKISVLRGRCLTPGGPQNDNSAFLCDLVDRRFFLFKIPVNKGYNISNTSGSAFLTASLNGGSAWTWQTLVQDLCTTLGLGTQTLPFTPNATPNNLTFFGASAWEAVNSVLDRIGCTFKYDAETDTFTIIRQGDTTAAAAVAETALQTKLDTAGLKTWDGYWNEPARGRLPEKVRVLFPRRPQPKDGSSILYAVDVPLAASPGVVAGTYETLHDDFTAVGAGVPTNAAALTTRAAERAADWQRKRLYSEARQTLVYRDFQTGPAFLCETTGTVIYDDRGSGSMRTELASAPDGLMEAFRAYEQPLVLESEAVADCCPESPPPETLPLECPGYGSGSPMDIGTICSIGHAEPPACNFLATSDCPPDDLPSYTFTSLTSGTTVSTTQMACIIANSTCTTTSISWKACLITGSGPGPCDKVKTATKYCVSIKLGTRAYSAVAGSGQSVAASLSAAGFGFSYATSDGSFSIGGTLVWCCKNGVTKLYFRGKISSQAVDPDNPTGFPCGCVLDITDGCSADNVETITAGPTYVSGVFDGETIHIKTDCGELDLVVKQGDCPAPPAACNACSLVGKIPTMVIPDGPNAGTYVFGAWAAVFEASQALFHDGTGLLKYAVTCYDAVIPPPNDILENALVLDDFNPNTGDVRGIAECGTPTIMTFPPCFGSTGDIIISTS